MYNKVIVAIDFSDSSQHVLDRAKELVGNDLEKLELIHVVEPIPTVWGMESYTLDPIELQNKILESSSQNLAEVGERNNIDRARQHTLLGPVAEKIRELQDEIGADAIVIGSHGHSGWKLMLGSTATSLLHGATVDVVTVFIKESS
ncbi:MAG: universal stress protein [Gammaproteobacteria bacterium]|nr:universal stress protein [Gammaproteobacteria bacterium]